VDGTLVLSLGVLVKVGSGTVKLGAGVAPVVEREGAEGMVVPLEVDVSKRDRSVDCHRICNAGTITVSEFLKLVATPAYAPFSVSQP